MVLEGTSLAH